MSQEYRFEFLGTKEAFLNNLDRFSHNSYSNSTFYYFDDYIVKQTDDEIHFGVARGGHSGGYWFIPTITEFDNRIEFCGTIRRVGGGNDPKDIKRVCNSIGDFMFMILLMPIVLVIKLYTLVEGFIRKIVNRPKPKAKANEERLFDLMENYCGCIGK